MPYFLIILGVIARLFPHPWNFTPIGALGLFAGANVGPRVAWLVPLSALLIADLILGFYEPMIMLFVYLGFLAGPLLGRLMLSKKRSVARIGGAVFASSTIFFVLSNFGVWVAGYYPHTLAGLVECYVLAIPFYGVLLVGDAFYAGILFGGQEMVTAAIRRRGDQRLSI